MVRMVDKDKLITSMAWHYLQDMILSIDDILDIIEAFPTLNQLEIVCCQDCENHWDLNGKHICVKLNCNCPNDSEFFCKFGRKKNGNTTD